MNDRRCRQINDCPIMAGHEERIKDLESFKNRLEDAMTKVVFGVFINLVVTVVIGIFLVKVLS